MRKLYIIAVSAIAALAVSCSSDFLTVESNSQTFLEDYFTTEPHLQEALIAAYDPLEWFDWTNQYSPVNIMSDIMADQIWVGGSDKTDNAHWHLMMNYEAIPTNTLSSLISDCYSGVKRCNDVLTYMGWVEDLPADIAASVEAQARVLRAFYYTILWKFWGNIPYYEINLTGAINCKPFTADEV